MDNYEPYEVTEKAKALSKGNIEHKNEVNINIDFNRVLLKGNYRRRTKGN